MLEVLIVISVAALLIAILIPAVMSAREASRRNQCVSHLRQIGVALQNFEATHQRLPAHLDYRDGHRLPLPKWRPLHMELLPFLDQMAVYNAIDLKTPSPEAWRVDLLPPVSRTRIEVFICPSNAGRPGISYRGCTGSGPELFEKGFWPGGDGIFSNVEGWKTSDITDGLSHTVAFSEKIPSDLNPAFGLGDFIYSGVSSLAGRVATIDEGVSALRGACENVTNPPYYHAYAGRTWYLPRYSFTLYNHSLAPNSGVPDCAGMLRPEAASDYVVGPALGLFTATSFHRGGVNLLYCDGHVRFASDSVDQAVWRASATRAGKEIIEF